MASIEPFLLVLLSLLPIFFVWVVIFFLVMSAVLMMRNSAPNDPIRPPFVDSNEVDQDRALPITIWLEKNPEKGEDAFPLVSFHPDLECGCIAVMDGMGGIGSTKYKYGGQIRTGAYIAAHLAAQTVQQWLKEIAKQQAKICSNNNHTGETAAQHSPLSGINSMNEENSYPPYCKHRDFKKSFSYTINIGEVLSLPFYSKNCFSQIDIHSLERLIDEHFTTKATQLEPLNGESRIIGRGIRKLPTTLALSYFHIRDFPRQGEQFHVKVSLLWSGDSRIYFMSERAFEQLTTDDVKARNPLHDALPSDAPLDNFISEQTPNRLNERNLVRSLPGVLISCTDGAYNYFPTPIHFEAILRGTLKNSSSSLEWAQELARKLKTLAGDDVSMVIVPLGFSTFTEMRNIIGARETYIQEKFIKPFEHSYEALQKELNKLNAAKKMLQDSELEFKKCQAFHEKTLRNIMDDYVNQINASHNDWSKK